MEETKIFDNPVGNKLAQTKIVKFCQQYKDIRYLK